MNRENTIKVCGVLALVGFGASLYSRTVKKRDRLASELVREITNLIKPKTKGLLSEDGFDINHKSNILKEVGVGTLIKVLKPWAAEKFAKKIHSAWSMWDDDEEIIYAVFRKLRDKVQVSQVAKAYQSEKLYSKNLVDVFNDRLSKEEVQKILGIVNKLERYRRA